MPQLVSTADIVSVDTNTLEIDDAFPGTYGFAVLLNRDPGPEWGVEFDAVYEVARYPGKPPVLTHGDRLHVFYLPRYADDLPNFLRFLRQQVAEANRAVEQRNSVLPDDEKEKKEFLRRLREAADREGLRSSDR